MKDFSRRRARVGITRRLRRETSRRNPNGKIRNAAILLEFALVIPIFLLFTLGIMEFAFLFFIQHSMFNSARDAARSYAIRALNATETQQLALQNLSLININFSVQVSPQNDSGIDRWVEISAPISEASLGDPLNVFSGDDLRVRVAMRREE